MPQPLSLLIFIAQSDKAFAPWRRISQAEARRRGARVSGQEGEGLVGNGGIARLCVPLITGPGPGPRGVDAPAEPGPLVPGRLRGHRAGRPQAGSQRLGSRGCPLSATQTAFPQ